MSVVSTDLTAPKRLLQSVPDDRNTGAAFAVDKADDPLREIWPFLLIVRTGRIVTGRAGTQEAGVTRPSTAGYSEFPANSQLHFSRSLARGAVPGHVSGGSTLGPL